MEEETSENRHTLKKRRVVTDMFMHDHEKAMEVFRKGTVIPATPLALDEDKHFDEDSQRLLMRYYLHSGAGGIATAVHSTQFSIREHGLFEKVISVVSEEIDSHEEKYGKNIFKVCGVCGPIEQAVKEAGIAKEKGFDAVLVSPGGLKGYSNEYLLERTAAIADVLPVIGFYLQPAVGGRILPYEYWRKMADIPGVIGIKCASFGRYTTCDVMRAVVDSPRCDEITMYTGNDDNIVSDFLSVYKFGEKEKRFEGGLLGHWCIWTKKAVELLSCVKDFRATGKGYEFLSAAGPAITDMNSAVFDSVNSFAGCISGIHEVLRRQGLMKNILCLDEIEKLSPGQAEEITRVMESYPQFTDDDFVKENIEKWKTQV